MSPFPILVPLALSLRLTLVAVDPEMRPPTGTPAPRERTEAADDSLLRPDDHVYVEELPAQKSTVPPVYPEQARHDGIQGTVIVQALVGRDGTVKEVRVAKSIPKLDAAAVTAVRQWTFRPARSEGRPVAVWVAVPVKFTLRGTVTVEAMLRDAVAELQRAGPRAPSPQDAILRERIVRLALAANPPPEVPGVAKSRLETGRAAMDSLAMPGGADRAIGSLAAALNEAPWLAEPYELIAAALEAAGRPADAVVALELYLVANPGTHRWEEVRRKLAELRPPVPATPGR